MVAILSRRWVNASSKVVVLDDPKHCITCLITDIIIWRIGLRSSSCNSLFTNNDHLVCQIRTFSLDIDIIRWVQIGNMNNMFSIELKWQIWWKCMFDCLYCGHLGYFVFIPISFFFLQCWPLSTKSLNKISEILQAYPEMHIFYNKSVYFDYYVVEVCSYGCKQLMS